MQFTIYDSACITLVHVPFNSCILGIGFSNSIVTLSIQLHKIEEYYAGLTAPAKTKYYYYTSCWWIAYKIMLLQWLANGSQKVKSLHTKNNAITDSRGVRTLEYLFSEKSAVLAIT